MNPIVLIASYPPPVAGQSLATSMLTRALDQVAIGYERINIAALLASRGRPLRWFGRVRVVLSAYLTTLSLESEPQRRLLYLQLGHGRAAMFRDLLLLEIARQRRWPTILHVHGGGYRVAFETLPALVRERTALHLRSAERVVVLSNCLRHAFDGLSEKVVVIENGIVRDFEEAASKWALRKPPPYCGPLRVLFLSNLLRSKGYWTVLQTAERAYRHGMPIEFHIAGAVTDSTGEEPEAFVRRTGVRNIVYHGPVAGAAKTTLFEQADLFVLPSHGEGQPLVLLEAMHYALPIVATSVGGIPDLFSEGDGGFYIERDDVGALLDRIVRLSDPALRRRFGQRNREQAIARFSEAIHGRNMLALLRAVAAENGIELSSA